MLLTIRVNSWQDTKQLSEALSGCVYRGQANASWELTTTLQRATTQFSKEEFLNVVGLDKWLSNREIWVLREFQRRAHHYVDDLPPTDRTLEWLALIQHYGGPTRLLDFTHSFYVAAFFALENALTDACVWAVKTDPIKSCVKVKTEAKVDNERVDQTNQRHIQFVERFIGTLEEEKMVAYVEPERMNERLSIQQSLFLFPCDLAHSFQENLEASISSSTNTTPSQELLFPFSDDQDLVDFGNAQLIKIIIPKRSHTFALLDLKKANITSATLFPGLDGFARSLYLNLRGLDIDMTEYSRATEFALTLRKKS
jgi:hypothetical protein